MKEIELREVINDFDKIHTTERIILIGRDEAIRQIILGDEEEWIKITLYFVL